MVAKVAPDSAPVFKLWLWQLLLVFDVFGFWLISHKTVLPTVAATIHISNGIYLRNSSKGYFGRGLSVAG